MKPKYFAIDITDDEPLIWIIDKAKTMGEAREVVDKVEKQGKVIACILDAKKLKAIALGIKEILNDKKNIIK